MPFDPAHVQVPFAMRPGLARLGSLETGLNAPSHFTPITPALQAEKQAVWQAEQAVQVAPGFDALAIENAIKNIAACAGFTAQNPNFSYEIEPIKALSLSCAEDLAVIDGRPESAHFQTVPWLNVCVPSHWAPEEKVGLTFAAIHEPVADNALIMRAASHLVKLATSGQAWERFVWTISPSPRHDQHPKRHARTPWPTLKGQALLDALFLRWERQTLLPIAACGGFQGQPSGLALFTIRVQVEPLAPWLAANPGAAQRMAQSLHSMSAAVLAYKGLTEIAPALVQALSRTA